MSGRLTGIVLSVIMLWFQYSLKLSFSSTFAGLYCTYSMAIIISILLLYYYGIIIIIIISSSSSSSSMLFYQGFC
jgi:hypothetical protein